MNRSNRGRLLAATLLLLAFGTASASRELSYVRACWANLRVLEGAVELYEMDKGKQFFPRELGRIQPQDIQRLVGDRYLHEMPVEPGHDKTIRYLFVPGPGFFCLTHGAPGGKTSPRDQLEAAGVKDPTLLAAASTEVPSDRPRSHPSPTDLLVLGAIVAGGGFVLIRYLLRPLFRKAAGWLVPSMKLK